MESYIEQYRSYHEEIERLEQEIVRVRLLSTTSARDAVNNEHRIKKMLERVTFLSKQLQAFYEDHDGLRKQEMQGLGGPNDLYEFSMRMRKVREYYRTHPHPPAEPMRIEVFSERPTALAPRKREAAAAPIDGEVQPLQQQQQRPSKQAQPAEAEEIPMLVEFSDEEGFGRFLDLQECHQQFLNLKNGVILDYIDYIDSFDKLEDYPQANKNATYRKYVSGLVDYLIGFIRRAKPLFDIDKALQQEKERFEASWSAGTFKGWPKQDNDAEMGEAVDLSRYSSAEELQALGLDRLKSALIALNLKCGGTLQQRAERLFAAKGKTADKLDKSLKAAPKKQSDGKEAAALESQVYFLAELLKDVRAQTRDNVERKFSRTVAELEEEEEHELQVAEAEESEEEDNTIIYNPKGLPLGWDGKPIPYWLYKLHGLNITYSCQICGDAVYKGPKMFVQHFQEGQHARGMKSLGIPNTAHFVGVTQIKDALALWEKLKKNKDVDDFQAGKEEEFEDSAGNVVNKKTYEDLKRQGLL